jgi:hypothetical protein
MPPQSQSQSALNSDEGDGFQRMVIAEEIIGHVYEMRKCFELLGIWYESSLALGNNNLLNDFVEQIITMTQIAFQSFGIPRRFFKRGVMLGDMFDLTGN